jgi:hypothetical protein
VRIVEGMWVGPHPRNLSTNLHRQVVVTFEHTLSTI